MCFYSQKSSAPPTPPGQRTSISRDGKGGGGRFQYRNSTVSLSIRDFRNFQSNTCLCTKKSRQVAIARNGTPVHASNCLSARVRQPCVEATCPSRATTRLEPSDWLRGLRSNRGKVRIPTLLPWHANRTHLSALSLSLSCYLQSNPVALCLCALELYRVYVRIPLSTNMPSEKTVTKASETRRSTKPIMEKRRRARINNSLLELKKKADILEMTVKYLKNLQRQQMTPDPAAMSKYRSGFAECANEVSRFVNRMDGSVDPAVRQRLLNHLANCLNGMNNPTPLPPVHVQVGPTPESDINNRLLQGVQLVPTRLPNGDIAFLLPANLSVYTSPSVPISPTNSTSSVTSSMSTTSSPSPVNVLGSSGILSPAASDRSSPSPLSLHHPTPVQSHCPVIVQPSSCQPQKVESKAVWRPF
ncbi:transcription factor HES-4-B [Caerostris extrusa]|uniref:Transcription factor HES-4-B n=1 Tax=Caerostris extrusa TaxID=172846 RepID=A0AAV4NFJ6_CAEEX|nr:transcription factor HES-4-B [Caerostris extrusa]